jgi:membrane protein
MLGADFFAVLVRHRIYHRFWAIAAASAIRFIGWTLAIALLTFCFAIIYYWAPDMKTRRWYWLTPGGNVAILG